MLSFLVRWTGLSADWRDWRPPLVGQLVFNETVTVDSSSLLGHYKVVMLKSEGPIS